MTTDPNARANTSITQSICGSSLINSIIIANAGRVYTNSCAPDGLNYPSVDELAGHSLPLAAHKLRNCLESLEGMQIAIERLALVDPRRVVDLLRQVNGVELLRQNKLSDGFLWGCVLLYMGEQQCRLFINAMTMDERTQTERWARWRLQVESNEGRSDTAAVYLRHTDPEVAATLLANMPQEYSAHILAASSVGDRRFLLNAMFPVSVYQFAEWSIERQPIVGSWLGAMRPDRIAAVLTNTKPQRQVVIAIVRALNTAQGPAATAEMLVAARVSGEWADVVLRALGPVAAAEVLECGQRRGSAWAHLLRPDLLACIAGAVDATRAAALLEPVAPDQMAQMLPMLTPKVAVPILTNLNGATVANILGALASSQTARLLGMSAWRIRLDAAFGTVPASRSRKTRVTRGLVVRAKLLAHALPDVIGCVLAEMSPTAAAALLTHMPVNLVRQIIDIAFSHAPAWLRAMPPGAAIEIMAALDSRRAADLLTALPSGHAVRLLAMTRTETVRFEVGRLREAMKRVASAAWDRQGRRVLEAQCHALRRTWRLLAALQIAEAEPMAVLVQTTAVNLWQNLDPQVRECLRNDMSDLAQRRLLGGSGNH